MPLVDTLLPCGVRADQRPQAILPPGQSALLLLPAHASPSLRVAVTVTGAGRLHRGGQLYFYVVKPAYMAKVRITRRPPPRPPNPVCPNGTDPTGSGR